MINAARFRGLIFSSFVLLLSGPAFGQANDALSNDSVANAIIANTSASDEYVEWRVLSDTDANLYREIFALQENGSWKAADKKIANLENDILLGYVQFQRYMHPTAYRSSFTELKRWMAFYADHPEAQKVYSLASRRRPKGYSSPRRWTSRKWRQGPAREFHPDLEADYARKGRSRVKRIEGRVRHLSNREKASTALKEIDRHLKRGTITTRQYDRMRSWIAASFYYQGYVDTARRISNQAANRSGDTAVLSYWIAGLIAFRDGNIEDAHRLFDRMAKVTYQEDSLRSAAGFWASRTALLANRADNVVAPLNIAAQYPFTFYGQLALAQLGRDPGFDWDRAIVTRDGLAKLTATTPRINRAIALTQAGRASDADTELRWANGEITDQLDYDLLAIAQQLDLPSAQLDIALLGNAKYLEAGLFPIPEFSPADGFKVDRALIYALMRQESKFKTDATSRVGARGLMQLMPRTASWVARDRSLQRRGRKGRDRLYDPGFNLSLGQKYVNQLIDAHVDGNVFHLAAAYNGGPGNLSRWRREVAIDDPLLFIESIPSRESRDFVEKVLTNFWVYRARLGQSAPTRDKVAAGELPVYEALDQIAGE